MRRQFATSAAPYLVSTVIAALTPVDARAQSTPPPDAAPSATQQGPSAPQQGEVTTLPPLDVTAQSNKSKKAKPKPQAKTTPETSAVAAPAPNPTEANGSGSQAETATGPVDGYSASRSATATKTDTPIIETPQSISVVTADQMATMKAQSLADALAYTPGIMQAPGYANSYDVFFSRGFRIQDGTGNMYRDGLKLGGSGWATGQQEPYGLERVELLKGAASVLFGAASPGGILNTVSKRPQREAFKELKVEGGNYDHFSVAGDINQPLSPDLSFRLVGVMRDSETWVDFVPNDSWYLAPSLAWTPSDRTSFTLMAHAQERHTKYINGVPAQGSLVPSPYGKIPRERFVGEPGWDKQETEQFSVTGLFSHEFSDGLTFRQGARYLDSENHVPFVALGGWSGSAKERTAIDNMITTEGVSTDTSLEYKLQTGPLRHTLISGVDYARYTTHDKWWTGSVADLDMFHPVYGSPVGAMDYLGDFGSTISRLGVYAQDQLKVGNLNLLFGGRHDWATDTPAEGGEKEDSSAFTGRAGAVYLFDNGFAPFVSFSQSFEPQSGSEGGKRFEPTEGEQVEGGIRWQSPDERFLASVAVYDLTQTNVVSTRPDRTRVQTGEVQSRGFEFEAKGEIARDWSVIASYAYTHAITTKSEIENEIGQERPDVPKHQAALWVERANLGIDGFTAGVGARFVGETKDWEGTNAEVPAFVTFDAMLAYEQDFWRLALNGSNIFDELTMQCSFATCTYGDGRRVTLTLSRTW